MEYTANSIYTKPKDWETWVIGTFDPSFEQPPRFFVGWDKDRDEFMALLVQHEFGFDKAMRMTKDEADNEMLLVQACVGPEVFVYKMPWLPPKAKPSDKFQPAVKRPTTMAEQWNPRVHRALDTVGRIIEDPVLVVMLVAATTLFIQGFGL